ncbi:MAG: hypothetical protein HZB33_11870 [Nitrospirae bacterium]|nr:hypothetical protein [Nitrospirota bacterium]
MTKKISALCMTIAIVIAYGGTLHAQERIRGFVFETIDHKTIDSAALKGRPMVINIGSHW